MRILLIEPDKILADIYSQALAESGHTVNWQPDAQQAVLAADERKPDAVILELQLAAHNGVEFLYEFRSYSEWQDIPVVVLSTVPDVSLSPTLQSQLGVVAYHYKPRTTLKQLLEVLDELAVPV